MAVLQAENERLIALLEANGIEWRPAREPATPPSKPELSRLSIEAKVALFRRRFQGRTDVYPVRWESKATGKSGYAPACANEWRAGVCEKPRIKCGDCRNRSLIPLSDAAIFVHLAGAGSRTDLGVPVAIETSRSGNGAHAWTFFANRVSAQKDPRLAYASRGNQ